MSRDYKYTQHQNQDATPAKPLLWLLLGLVIGVAVTLLLMPSTSSGLQGNQVGQSSDSKSESSVEAVLEEQAAQSNDSEENITSDDNKTADETDAVTLAATLPVDCNPAEVPLAAEEYEFYNLLPKLEVPVLENRYSEPEATPVAPSLPLEQTAVEKQGSYLLQVASLRSPADADRLIAKLGMMGLVAHMQKITIDEDTVWHRVRVGPIDSTDQVNATREQLRVAGYATLPIRINK